MATRVTQGFYELCRLKAERLFCTSYIKIRVCVGIIIKKYVWLLSLIFVLLLSYILARMAALFVASYFPDENFAAVMTSGETALFAEASRQVAVDKIIQRNFFDATESSFENTTATPTTDTPDEEVAPVQTDGVAVKTSLALALVSTISFGNGEDRMSSCVVAVSSKQQVYGVGDALGFPQTQLIRVLPKRIEFSHKGRLEFAEINEDSVPSTSSEPTVIASNDEPAETPPEEAEAPTEGINQEGNHFTVKKSLVDAALGNTADLLKQARAVQYYDNGKPVGYQFRKVSNKSIFYQLGIRRGDIVKSVNDKTLDMASGMQTFTELKDLRNFKIQVTRRGVDQEFTYDVVD